MNLLILFFCLAVCSYNALPSSSKTTSVVASPNRIGSSKTSASTPDPCIVTPQMTDCEAVISIWKGLNNDALSPFPDISTCCDINGVQCTDDKKYVKSIIWLGEGLNGDLQCQIAVLTKLEDLVIGDSWDFKSLPANLGKLSNLKTLTIVYCAITSLPNSIGDLTQLRQLIVSWTFIDSLPNSLSKLINLRSLEVSYNDFFKESIPSTLQTLPNLQTLRLNDNNLSGKIPNFLGNMPYLESLDLGNNNLDETIPISLLRRAYWGKMDLYSRSDSVIAFHPPPSNPTPFTITKKHPLWYHDFTNAPCVSGNLIKAPNNPNWPLFKTMHWSANFDLRWNSTKYPNLLTKEKSKKLLDRLEEIYKWMTSAPINLPPLFCQSSTKYKFIIFLDPEFKIATGSGESIPKLGEIPSMWVSSLGVNNRESTTDLVHEMSHGMQYHSKGMRATGSFWETHAEFLSAQYPETIDKEKIGWSSYFINKEGMFWNEQEPYCNFLIANHLAVKYGFKIVNDVFLKSANYSRSDQVSYLDVLRKNNNWSASQIGAEYYEMHARNVNFDYIDRDGFDRGKVFRDIFGPITYKSILESNRLTRLQVLDLKKRQFGVSSWYAPQQYGVNLIRLHPDNGATSIQINFRGVVQSAQNPNARYGSYYSEPIPFSDVFIDDPPSNPGSNWRWGTVIITSTGVTRYGPMQSGAKASYTLSIDENDEEIYVVLVAAPDNPQKILFRQGHHTIYRFPYQLQFVNALPDGYQPGYLPFHGAVQHPNGGGYINPNANVAPTAYVGPEAIVLGGNVLGNARIEDYAIVNAGTVRDNAIFGGRSILEDNSVTISGNAVIKAFKFVTNPGMTITGTVKIFGSMEWSGMEGKTVNAGAYTSLVDNENINYRFYGAKRDNIPDEVTNRIPSTWIS